LNSLLLSIFVFSLAISTEATVPGGIYSDLRRGNILKEDVYYRDNDLKYRWVSKTGWTYSTEFEGNEPNSALGSLSLFFFIFLSGLIEGTLTVKVLSSGKRREKEDRIGESQPCRERAFRSG
jgi:hypothetical protein